MRVKYLISLLFFIGISLTACKIEEKKFIPNNNPPHTNSVSTIIIENYINRLFIDLLGREALANEIKQFTDSLKAENLSIDSRFRLIRKLQNDTQYRDGDSSYRKAYIMRLYNLNKLRFLEGADDGEIYQQIGNLNFFIAISRLNGDSIGVYYGLNEIAKYENIINSVYAFYHNKINYNKLCGYMINNGIYDKINMGSFNFVNATFDDILNRKPTVDEFQIAYEIIDKNKPQTIFNQKASNKNEYIEALMNYYGFYEAQIHWWHYQYVRKEIPSSQLLELLNLYLTHKDISLIQAHILSTDIYAQF